MSLIYKSEVIDIYPYPSLNPNEEGRRGGEWEESQRNVSKGSSRRGGKALTQSVWLMTTIKVEKEEGKRREENRDSDAGNVRMKQGYEHHYQEEGKKNMLDYK